MRHRTLLPLMLPLVLLPACGSPGSGTDTPAPREMPSETRGAFQDFNGNGVEDAVDIALGTSLDENQNAIPDEAEDLGH